MNRCDLCGAVFHNFHGKNALANHQKDAHPHHISIGDVMAVSSTGVVVKHHTSKYCEKEQVISSSVGRISSVENAVDDTDVSPATVPTKSANIDSLTMVETSDADTVKTNNVTVPTKSADVDTSANEGGVKETDVNETGAKKMGSVEISSNNVANVDTSGYTSGYEIGSVEMSSNSVANVDTSAKEGVDTNVDTSAKEGVKEKDVKETDGTNEIGSVEMRSNSVEDVFEVFFDALSASSSAVATAVLPSSGMETVPELSSTTLQDTAISTATITTGRMSAAVSNAVTESISHISGSALMDIDDDMIVVKDDFEAEQGNFSVGKDPLSAEDAVDCSVDLPSVEVSIHNMLEVDLPVTKPTNTAADITSEMEEIDGILENLTMKSIPNNTRLALNSYSEEIFSSCTSCEEFEEVLWKTTVLLQQKECEMENNNNLIRELQYEQNRKKTIITNLACKLTDVEKIRIVRNQRLVFLANELVKLEKILESKNNENEETKRCNGLLYSKCAEFDTLRKEVEDLKEQNRKVQGLLKQEKDQHQASKHIINKLQESVKRKEEMESNQHPVEVQEEIVSSKKEEILVLEEKNSILIKGNEELKERVKTATENMSDLYACLRKANSAPGYVQLRTFVGLTCLI